MYDHNDFRPRRLYRSTKDSRAAGVFSGIAEYLNVSVGFTRLLGVIAILMTFPLGLFAYVIAALVLKPMPASAYHEDVDYRFVRSIRRSPEETFSNVRYRFRNIENRLRKMERYVTSSRYDLDKEFDELRRN